MASQATKTKQERVAEKEAKIIAAARRIFLRKGVEGTRMSEIARTADVAEGTLYLYFRNKEALLHAISGAHWAELTQGAHRAIAGCESAMDGLHALADYHMAIMIKDRPLIELSVALAGSSDAGEHAIHASKRAYAGIFDMLYTRGVDRGEFRAEAERWFMRDLFYGTLEYAARTVALHDKPDDQAVAVASMMRVLTDTLMSEASPGVTRNDLEAVTERLETAANRLEKLAR